MDSEERKTIVSVAGLIMLFAFLIAILVSPVEIDGNIQMDLDTRLSATGGDLYTGVFSQYFDGQSKITLDKNTTLSVGINKANVSYHIKTPIFGLWLFKDNINNLFR